MTTKSQKTPPGLPSVPLVVLPTATDEETLAALRKAGYIPVLTDEPERIRILMPGSEVTGNDLLMSAMHGICETIDPAGRNHFALEMGRRLRARENAPNSQSAPKT